MSNTRLIIMALYSIKSEQFLGLSHSGPVSVNGESAVELSDEEVDILVSLIREKNTTDVEELGLEQLYPDIYEKLREAYYQMAYDAEEMDWLWQGYKSSYFEYNTDDLMEYCEKNCGFIFKFKPEEYFDEDDLEYYHEDPDSYEDEIHEVKCEKFNEWLDEYVHNLSDDEARSFFYDHMNADLCLDNISYDVKIPGGVIKKAKG